MEKKRNARKERVRIRVAIKNNEKKKRRKILKAREDKGNFFAKERGLSFWFPIANDFTFIQGDLY